MGFWNNLGSFIRDVGDICKEAGEVFKESAAEFGEIMTDGFKELVIDGKTEYLTSFEKRELANRVMKGMKREYEDAKNSFLDKIKNTNKKLVEFNQYKIEIFQGILNEWFNVVKPYQEEILKQSLPWIDDLRSKYGEANLAELSKYIEDLRSAIKDMDSSKNDSDNILALLLGNKIFFPKKMPIPGLPSLNYIGGLIEQHRRVEASNDYLSDAKDFRIKVQTAIEAINQEKTKLDLILMKIHEAEFLLKDAVACLQEQIKNQVAWIIDPKKEYLARYQKAATCKRWIGYGSTMVKFLLRKVKSNFLTKNERNILAIGNGLACLIIAISQVPIINEHGQVSEAFTELYSGIETIIKHLK